MEGASASGTYTFWPPSGWQLMFVTEGYGDKSEPCTTTGFCNSGTITNRWGHNAADPNDASIGLFAPPNPDPLRANGGFGVLATQDIIEDGERRYVMKGAVKIPITVPATGRPIFMFDWAFATAELNSGPTFNDVARIVFRSAGNSDVTIFEISRNDLQPGGSGSSFTSIVRKNGDGTPRSCGTTGIGGFSAEYVLCTEWQRAQIDMTPFLGQVGQLIPSVEETPYTLDENNRAFEAEPRPSAFTFANLRLSSATALLTEGVQGAVALSFPAVDVAVGEQVIGYTFNVPGCSVVASGLTSTAQVTCPDNGNYPFSINRLSTGSTVCNNVDPFTNDCIANDYEDDEYRTFGLIQASNVAPTATFVAPATAPAGQTFQLALTNPHDAAGDLAAGFTYAFDCGDGTFSPPGSTASSTCPAAASPGTRNVRGKILDKDGGSTTYAATVLSDNLITSISVPPDPVLVDIDVQVITAFSAVPGETYSATIVWDDGGAKTNKAAVVSGFKAKHAYSRPGLYTVTVTVQGNKGSTDTRSAATYVVVYDPTGGFMSGAGWIQSPAGAYSADASAAGRADFAFSAKYPTRTATTPTGAAEFSFVAGNLSFTSTSYQWLVIPTPGKAKLKGTGRINGGGSYEFILTAVDAEMSGADADRVRMKIWNSATGAVVYDNQRLADGSSKPDDNNYPGTALRGGNINVQKR